MTALRTLLLLFTLLCGSAISAQIAAAGYDTDLAFAEARSLAFSGQHTQARATLRRILSDHPDYADVEILLARTYSWEGEYNKARNHLNRVTSRNRTLEDSWVAAIKNELYAGNTSLALGLANKALIYLNSSREISKIRSGILASNREPGGPGASDASGESNPVKNYIGIENAFETFDKAYRPMVYASMEYQYHGRLGKVIPRIHYSNRFETHGVQYELDLYPKISRVFYGYLNYAYSNAATYPGHRIGAEIYASLPGALETSLGIRHLDFRESNAILFTGTFGIYRGSYYMGLRPFISFIKDRDPGFSGSFQIRKYLARESNYIGLRGGYGINTELRQLRSGDQLLAETLLFVESQELQIEYQFGEARGNNRYRAQVGVSRQEFVSDPGSFFWALRAGLRYQAGF